MTDRVIPTAIACCATCLTGYALHEWQALHLLDDGAADQLGDAMTERRLCATCAGPIVAVVEGFPEGGVWWSEEQHREAYPHALRESHEAPRPFDSARLLWGGAVALLVVASVALLTAVVRVVWGAW